MAMKHDRTRRDFLKATATTATALAAARVAQAADDAKPEKGKADDAMPPLPTRKLGRSGVEVSVLNQGCAMRMSQRLLDYTYKQGVRYFDTADCYGRGSSEKEVAKWFERTGKRKEIFLVTKAHPHEGPEHLADMVDERLKALKTDFIDLFFIHALCDDEYPRESVDWPKSEEFKKAAEKLKKSGKCKLVGFSVHHNWRAKTLIHAAEGGFVDAIMFKYDPRTVKNDEMSAAMDACVKAGIGLIAMKTQSSAAAFKDRWEKLKTGKLSVQQAVVKAVLSDERLTGMTSHMESFKHIDENTAAARDTKPLAAADRALLDQLYADGPHRLCDACNGACGDVIGRPHALHDVARAVMYYELYGQRQTARELFASLNSRTLDLDAESLERAKAACADGLDYPGIFAKARQYFG